MFPFEGRRFLDTLARTRSVLRRQLRGRFLTYDEALAAGRGDGYGATAVAEMVCLKTTRLLTDPVSNGIAEFDVYDMCAIWCLEAAATASSRRPIRVLDFGGAAGAHFFKISGLFRERLLLDWVVLETPPMVQCARKTISAPGLTFSDTRLDDLRAGSAVLLANNSLQYARDPLLTLGLLLQARPAFVCLGRVATGPGSTTSFSVQKSRLIDNGPGRAPEKSAREFVEYPITLVPEKSLLGAVSKEYVILGCHRHQEVVFQPGGGFVRYVTLLMQHRAVV